MKNEQHNSNIINASVIVSVIVVIGKVTGFARDAVIAAFYGVNWQTDAFFFAQNMPSMIFPAVCSSLSTAFISLYVSHSIKKGEKSGERYASRMLISSILIAVALSILALVFAPWIVPVFSPGFTEEQTILTIHLTRLTMGSFVLVMVQYMLTAILNSKKLFYGAQFAALFYNLSIILITIFLGHGQSMEVLTLTVVIGNMLQVVMLIAFIWKKFDFTLENPFHKETKELIKIAAPILFGNSIVQLNNIVDNILASYLESGAVSALSYSSNLNRFVTGVFITTLSTVIYPSLSESFANNNLKRFNDELIKSLTLLPIVILPISIITAIYADDIVKIVYERGSFDISATKLTAEALAFYAGMYVFTSIQEIITRAFYALKDMKTPMVNAAIAVAANSVFSIILSKIIGIGGIALGTTISSALASVILLISIKKKLSDIKFNLIYNTVIKVIISAAVMITILLLTKNMLIYLSPLIRFVVVTIIGFLIYFGTLLLIKCEELINFINMTFRKSS